MRDESIKDMLCEIVAEYCYSFIVGVITDGYEQDETILKNINFDNGRVTFTVSERYREEDIFVKGIHTKQNPPCDKRMDIYYVINKKNDYLEELVRAAMLFRDWCYKVIDCESDWAFDEMLG